MGQDTYQSRKIDVENMTSHRASERNRMYKWRLKMEHYIWYSATEIWISRLAGGGGNLAQGAHETYLNQLSQEVPIRTQLVKSIKPALLHCFHRQNKNHVWLPKLRSSHWCRHCKLHSRRVWHQHKPNRSKLWLLGRRWSGLHALWNS
jgi:hypothetical protein